MKTSSRILAMLLVVAMVLSFGVVTAFAAGTGSITISGAVDGETYTAYKLFDVTYADTNSDNTIDAYSYYIAASVDSETGAYSKPALVTALEALGLTFTVSADGSQYIVQYNAGSNGSEGTFVKTTTTTGNDGESTTTTSTMTAAELAEAINKEMVKETSDLKTALGTGTTGTGTSTTTGEGDDAVTTYTYTISNLDAGYYFVDSSLGALCALDTATTSVTIYEKNSDPSIEKLVWEDSESKYQSTATIDVIDTVKYQLTVNTGSNTNAKDYDSDNLGETGIDANYTIVDTLPTGITYKTTTDSSNNTVQSVVVTTATGENGATETWTLNTDYTVTWNSTDNTLTIVLLSASTGKLASLEQNTDITITYEATVTASSVTLGYTADTDNTRQNSLNENWVTLTYQSQTVSADAVVYTYEIGADDEDGEATFTKIDGTTEEALEGVTFVLSKTENNTTYYAQVDSNYLTGWTTTESSATQITTDEDGKISVKGLDADTYILTETSTLDGYNLLTDTITVVISDNGTVTYRYTSKDENTAASSITVENSTGSILPSTGGMGTTLLYTIGIILVLGAGIVLVVRRRMRAE